MPDLLHSLQSHDLGYLRIVAGRWGIELVSNDLDGAIKELAASLLDAELAAELIASLTPQARQALAALVEAGGRITWATFVRQFGDVREMGAGKRDREKPHLNPASTAEILFYNALLARAFFDTDKGPQEFAYIPDDLLSLLNHEEHKEREEEKRKSLAGLAVNSELFGRAATPGEKAHIIPADDHILDDATTLLAALRLGHNISPDQKLLVLLSSAKLLSPSPRGRGKGEGEIRADAVKKFLEASRAEALKMLVEAWQTSETFNELHLIHGLICEGEWTNQPRVAREFLLNLLNAFPDGKWWNINAFVGDVKKKYPDFQRPAGDYDSWFIKRESDGQYLRGFAYWDQVDGALIRFFIQILHWLGMADLASVQPNGEITAFRRAGTWNWKSGIGVRDTNNVPQFSNNENGKLHISSQGKITTPRLVPRAVRYQMARFCEWEEEKTDEYKYRITPQSLTKAKEQGLKVEHLLALLTKHSDAGIPPVLVKALKRWELNGTEARAEIQVVLKVSRPEVLEGLRKSKAARFLGELLGPTSIVIKAGAQSKVMAALAEMGLLAEDNTDMALRAEQSNRPHDEDIASSSRGGSSQRRAKS